MAYTKMSFINFFYNKIGFFDFLRHNKLSKRVRVANFFPWTAEIQSFPAIPNIHRVFLQKNNSAVWLQS